MTKSSAQSAKQYWLSQPPTKCQIRGENIVMSFIDGSTGSGSWAIMCNECHKVFGKGLGIGKGQRFVLQGDGRFLKVSP
jgi:hypothetical protein